MLIVILQRRPEDQEGLLAAIQSICPDMEKNTHIFSYLKDAKDAIKTKGSLFEKKEKKDVFVITASVLFDVTGDDITKKIKKWNSEAKIYAFSASTDSFKKTKRLIGRYHKHKYQQKGYEDIATLIKTYLENGDEAMKKLIEEYDKKDVVPVE